MCVYIKYRYTHMHECVPTDTHTFVLAMGIPEIKEVPIIHIQDFFKIINLAILICKFYQITLIVLHLSYFTPSALHYLISVMLLV